MPPDVAAVWAGCERLTQRVAELVGSASASDGVRLAGVKFLETAVLALTADMSAAAAGRPAGAAPSHALLKPMEVCQWLASHPSRTPKDGALLVVWLGSWPAVLRQQAKQLWCMQRDLGQQRSEALRCEVQTARAAEGYVQQLLALVKAAGARQLSGSVAIVAVKAVAALGLLRPQHYLGRVMPTLLATAKAAAAQEVRCRACSPAA